MTMKVWEETQEDGRNEARGVEGYRKMWSTLIFREYVKPNITSA